LEMTLTLNCGIGCRLAVVDEPSTAGPPMAAQSVAELLAGWIHTLCID
jgi:hypothetical protein